MKFSDNKEKFKARYTTAKVFFQGNNEYLLQLRSPLFFSTSKDISFIEAEKYGDNVLVVEEWDYCKNEYDDLLMRWPYPKESHKFPKGWAESRRVCVSIQSEEHPYILYINRDSYSDELVIAQLLK